MPLYTFECENCGVKEELLLSVNERDEVQLCSSCNTRMQRLVDVPVLGKSVFQMQAILGDGKKVSGHFGKSAKKK